MNAAEFRSIRSIFKNQLCFHVPAMNNPKKKKRTKKTISMQKNKLFRNKFNHGGERLEQ